MTDLDAILAAIKADRIALSLRIRKFMLDWPQGYSRQHLADLVAAEIRKPDGREKA